MLTEWLNVNYPTLVLEGDAVIGPDDRLLARRTELEPYPRTSLQVLTWDGVDLKIESQGAERRPD
jgi:hypothetical protein